LTGLTAWGTSASVRGTETRGARHWIVGLLAGVWLLASGCSGDAKSPGRDPERMSQSEYDVARDLWLRQNKPREALAHALDAAELDEHNAEAAHLVALLYLDFCRRSPSECRLSDAEKYARQAVEAKPEFREAKNTLAVVLIHQKRYPEAVSVLKPLTADILYETPENAWGNLGWAYLEQGRTDLAVDALRRSIAAQPLFCVGNYRLGLAYERKREHSEALEALTRALDTQDPRCKTLQAAYAARARVLFRLGRADDARSDLTRCLELDEATESGKECSAMLRNLK
jgi:type IV pilus assembly protein PilF